MSELSLSSTVVNEIVEVIKNMIAKLVTTLSPANIYAQ